jgi:hypothetical protein
MADPDNAQAFWIIVIIVVAAVPLSIAVVAVLF